MPPFVVISGRPYAILPAMVQASASGKIILFGEHAVVYGRPAIAVPVTQVRATATVTAAQPGSGLLLDLPDIEQQWPWPQATWQPLAHVATLQPASLAWPAPGLADHLGSTIPIASGLGSGAAAATAIVRAMAAAAGKQLTPAQVSALVFESETLFHGQAERHQQRRDRLRTAGVVRPWPGAAAVSHRTGIHNRDRRHWDRQPYSPDCRRRPCRMAGRAGTFRGAVRPNCFDRALGAAMRLRTGMWPNSDR